MNKLGKIKVLGPWGLMGRVCIDVLSAVSGEAARESLEAKKVKTV